MFFVTLDPSITLRGTKEDVEKLQKEAYIYPGFLFMKAHDVEDGKMEIELVFKFSRKGLAGLQQVLEKFHQTDRG